jgi:Protein of unknown function (DUF1329)
MSQLSRLILPAAVILLLCVPLNAASTDPIPPGTTITVQNWQQYKQYMTDGMKALFAGTYHWKFTPDVQVVVEPTRRYVLGSPQYIENTEKYGSQVRIVTLPDGGHNIVNYVAGLPFSNPSGPLKGWEILVNDWFAYQPYELCTERIPGVYVDRFGNITTQDLVFLERRMAHISDAGQPINEPGAPGEDFVQYFEVTQPEQARYTSILTIYFYDLTKQETTFVFVPSLRRSLRLATTARCSPVLGSDYTYDDTRHGAFNGNITQFDATYLRDQPILEAPNVDLNGVGNLDNYYPGIFWAKPTLAKWQVRDTYVIDVHPIPSRRPGYCYGKRILYVDKEVMQAMWADLYDDNMKLWKIDYDPQAVMTVPGIKNKIWTNAGWGPMYDVQNDHMSLARLPLLANEQCRNLAGRDFTDLNRYFSVSGLSMIMQ